MKLKQWQTLSSEILFQDFWYTLRRDKVRLPNGQIIDDFYVSERPDFALVFAITKDHTIPFIRQYKHATQTFSLDLPGGTLEKGEDPSQCAHRELEEETGLKAKTLLPLNELCENPLRNTNKIHVFFATELTQTGNSQLDPIEAASGIEVVFYKPSEIPELIQRGKIFNVATVAALYLGLAHLGA